MNTNKTRLAAVGFLVLALSTAGVLLGTAARPSPAGAHIALDNNHLKAYSFQDVANTCQPATRSDPVGWLFYYKGIPVNADNHVIFDFVLLEPEEPFSQRFGVHGCHLNNKEPNNNSDDCPSNVARDHVRIRLGSAPGQPGVPDDGGATYKDYSLATPHHDSHGCTTIGCGLPPYWDGPQGHYVAEDVGNGKSGFTDAKDRGQVLMTSLGHTTADHQWDNEAMVEQCNGDFPKGNGVVPYIKILGPSTSTH